MAQAIRYRTGISRTTGEVLVGWPHLVQSLDVIWMTRIGERVMRLLFGSNMRGFLAEDIEPALALEIYDELATAVHRHEPEYRVTRFQFVRLTESGMLGLQHGGLYFPEGRFNNYDIAVPMTAIPKRFGRAVLS